MENTKKKTALSHKAEIRREAEQRVRRQEQPDVEKMSAEDVEQVLEELQVHQVELEMQNDELVRTRAELEESRKKYLDLYDFAPVGYCTIDEKGVIREANLTFSRMMGIERAYLVERMIQTFISLDSRNSFHSFLQGVFASGAPRRTEAKFQRADGSEFPAMIDGIPESGNHGSPRQCHCSIVDISERKKAEERLRRNEYELRTVVDNSPDIIFRLDRQMRYVYVNPTYERITGISRERFIGRTNEQLEMTRQMAELWRPAVRKVFESGRDGSVEFDMSGLFGTRYFSARLIPEFTKAGMVETVLVIARDVTERKHVEEEITALKK